MVLSLHPERLPPDANGLARSPKASHQQALDVPPACVLWSKSLRRESPACMSVPVGGRCVPGTRASRESRPRVGSAIWVGGGGQDQCLQGPRWPGRGWALGADTGSRRGGPPRRGSRGRRGMAAVRSPFALCGGQCAPPPALPRDGGRRRADCKVQRGGRLSPGCQQQSGLWASCGALPREERGPRSQVHPEPATLTRVRNGASVDVVGLRRGCGG